MEKTGKGVGGGGGRLGAWRKAELLGRDKEKKRRWGR